MCIIANMTNTLYERLMCGLVLGLETESEPSGEYSLDVTNRMLDAENVLRT
jgi:hypothetical protein